jgi:hypothetical protein
MTSPVEAQQLVLLVDVSSSISPPEYALQKEAYVEALRSPDIQHALRGWHIAIVEFSDVQNVVVSFNIDPDRVAEVYERSSRTSGSTTALSASVIYAINLIKDRPGLKVIDVSGDGSDNTSANLLTKVRPYAMMHMIEINCLVMEPDEWDTDAVRQYREYIKTGFMMQVNDIEHFYQALRQKLILEIVRSGNELAF